MKKDDIVAELHDIAIALYVEAISCPAHKARHLNLLSGRINDIANLLTENDE